MANSYTSASFEIPVTDPERVQKWMTWIAQFVDREIEHLPPSEFTKPVEMLLDEFRENGYLGFRWDVLGHAQTPTLWFSHDESIDMEAAAAVAMIILDLEGNDEVYAAEWANTCDKPRIGEFGGGTVVFNRHRSEWMSSSEAERILRQRFKERSSGHNMEQI